MRSGAAATRGGQTNRHGPQRPPGGPAPFGVCGHGRERSLWPALVCGSSEASSGNIGDIDLRRRGTEQAKLGQGGLEAGASRASAQQGELSRAGTWPPHSRWAVSAHPMMPVVQRPSGAISGGHTDPEWRKCEEIRSPDSSFGNEIVEAPAGKIAFSQSEASVSSSPDTDLYSVKTVTDATLTS